MREGAAQSGKGPGAAQSIPAQVQGSADARERCVREDRGADQARAHGMESGLPDIYPGHHC